jgi:hypothetical protein
MDKEFESLRNARETPHQLCQYCKAFFGNFHGAPGSLHSVRHYPAFADLQEGARQQCLVCSILSVKIFQPSKLLLSTGLVARINHISSLDRYFSVQWYGATDGNKLESTVQSKELLCRGEFL